MKAFLKKVVRFTLPLGALVLLAGFMLTGCRSMDKPASASFASAVVINQTPEKIRQAVIAVFQDNGYQIFSLSDNALVFQREATRGETIDYAGFAGAHEGTKVVMRVRVNVRPKDPSAYWVECKAYAVCNPDQQVFESTTALFGFQSKPYQKLMDQVAQRVAQTAPTP